MESDNFLGYGIRVNNIPKYANQNGLFKININEQQEVELNVANVQAIYYFNGYYYIVYSNPPIQPVPIPYLAIRLNFQVKDIDKEICKRCGDEIEYDADEPYCPSCGDYYGSKYIKLKQIIFNLNRESELEQFVSKLFNIKAKYYKYYFRSWANFKLSKLKVKILYYNIEEIGIVNDPSFEDYYYDTETTSHHFEKGKFIVVFAYTYSSLGRYAEGNYMYHLLTFEGEPDLTLFNQVLQEFQKEEEERKRREEEERKKKEEERKRREEEERKKWGNENNVVQEILAKMPDWADGVLIKTKMVSTGEDYYIDAQIYPIKKSSWNNDYYTSFEWKPISTNIPDKYLAKYEEKVILKDGKIANAKIGNQKGKYYPVSLA